MHIAIAEDHPDQLAVLSAWLQGAQHSVRGFGTAAAFFDALQKEHFDLLVIDWTLPDGTGADLLPWIRRNLGWDVPVLVLTTHDDEHTVVQALEAGADDYVIKRVNRLELLARVTGLGRRVRPSGASVLRLGAFEVDIARQVLTLDGVPVPLAQKEFDLSSYLFQNPGKLLSRDHLLNRVWGIHADVDTRTVDTHISRLRKKLSLDGSKGWRLVPIYGVGYRCERVDSFRSTSTP